MFNRKGKGVRQQAELLGQLGNGQADEFESVHAKGIRFNAPSSA
jgi:hypothetical protein